MALSALDDKSKIPDDEQLAEVLGESKRFWDEIADHLSEQYDPLTEEWKYSGQKWGWSLRLIHKKRTILYLTPGIGFYYTGFVLGGKAVEAAQQSGLPADVLDAINVAPKYAEGTGVRLEVRTVEDLEAVKKLAKIKMDN
jgi:hypothetical protein